MTACHGQTVTRMMLGQLCAVLLNSQSRPVVKQPAIKPGSVVTPLGLQCSSLDHCATREPLKLFQQFVVLQPEFKMDKIEFFLSMAYIQYQSGIIFFLFTN
jgi:hypothetical protein